MCVNAEAGIANLPTNTSRLLRTRSSVLGFLRLAYYLRIDLPQQLFQHLLHSVSNSSSDRPSDSATLYNPPSEGQGPTPSDDDNHVSLRLSMPHERAERLRAVAQQIGLSPSTVAKRAIEMVCDEVVTIQEDTRSPSLLVEQYQARIDLLHSVQQSHSDESSSDTAAVPDTATIEKPSAEDADEGNE